MGLINSLKPNTIFKIKGIRHIFEILVLNSFLKKILSNLFLLQIKWHE